MSSSPEKTHLGLVVGIGGRRCAIPLSEIAEVLRPLPIEPLPAAVEAVLGITVLRGASVPVIAPAVLLGEAAAPPGRFVALRLGERRVVLVVDQIHGVEDLDALTLEALPPLLRSADSDVIQTVGRLDHELLLVLQVARLVEDPLARAAGAGA